MFDELRPGFTEAEFESELLAREDVGVGSALEGPLQLLQLVG